MGKFNIYVFDGPHEIKDQYDGIAIVQPSLDDIFILIIDDWNTLHIRQGTLEVINDLNIKIISKIILHNGFYPRVGHKYNLYSRDLWTHFAPIFRKSVSYALGCVLPRATSKLPFSIRSATK